MPTAEKTVKEKASNVSEQRDKGWIHLIRVHDTIHLAGQQTLTNYPTQRKNERSRYTSRLPPSLVHRK